MALATCFAASTYTLLARYEEPQKTHTLISAGQTNTARNAFEQIPRSQCVRCLNSTSLPAGVAGVFSRTYPYDNHVCGILYSEMLKSCQSLVFLSVFLRSCCFQTSDQIGKGCALSNVVRVDCILAPSLLSLKDSCPVYLSPPAASGWQERVCRSSFRRHSSTAVHSIQKSHEMSNACVRSSRFLSRPSRNGETIDCEIEPVLSTAVNTCQIKAASEQRQNGLTLRKHIALQQARLERQRRWMMPETAMDPLHCHPKRWSCTPEEAASR